jgi:hypothetical protein
MTDPDPSKDLERSLHERLRALPELIAPTELVPAVLRKIALRAAPAWWRRPWLEWPRGLQLLSLVLLAAALGGAWYLKGPVAANASHWAGGMLGTFSVLKALWTVVAALVGVIKLLLASINPLWAVLAALVIAGIYLSTFGLGTLCYQVAANKRLSS